MNKTLTTAVIAASLWLPLAQAQEHDHAMHMQQMMQNQEAQTKEAPTKGAQSPFKDTRQVVHFPTRLRQHTLANMRDHLLTLQQIQEALAKQEFDQAGDIAEQRLGMSSLALHGAHEVAKYMPKGMQEAGSAMHRNASRLAVAAKDAAATNDMKPVLEALANVTAQCVACHAGYRVK
jgi:hypothetical protein